MLVAGDWAGGDRERFAGDEFDWLVVFQFAGANLWTRKIDKHRNRSSESFGCGAGTLNVDSLLFVRSMRHVDTHAVSARCDQLFNYFRLA
jgi:hypothetical protein